MSLDRSRVMKAIIYYGSGDIELNDVPDPPQESGRILIKVHASSICGGDYSMGKVRKADLDGVRHTPESGTVPDSGVCRS